MERFRARRIRVAIAGTLIVAGGTAFIAGELGKVTEMASTQPESQSSVSIVGQRVDNDTFLVGGALSIVAGAKIAPFRILPRRRVRRP